MSGTTVNDLPLAWPATLERAPRPAIVYLDQNHFINLAKYAHGNLAFKHYDALLAAVLRASMDGRAVFPLSTVHFMETGQIGNSRRRRDVAELMEAVSEFATLLGRPMLARLEIEAAVLNRLGMPQPLNKVSLVGRGVLHAFGRPDGLNLRDGDGTDITAALRDEVGHLDFDEEMARAALKLNRSVLGGPAPEELEGLRARGYAPETLRADMESRLTSETEFAGWLTDPANRRVRDRRLRDAVAARELAYAGRLTAEDRQMRRTGASIADVMGRDAASARSFLESMPSTRVTISIKTRYHRNPQRPWTTNDLFDIDALSVAVAYCDAVLSDKQVWSAVRSGRELEPMRAFFPRTPEEMADWVDRLG